MQQQIFEKIFGIKSNHPNSAKLLSEVTEKYPYFSAAHYYQLKFSYHIEQNLSIQYQKYL
jgi:hypothetical protein